MTHLSLSHSLQVEKVKQAFLSVFPFTSAAPQSVMHSTSEGYSSFPMRTCRRQHHNQYPFSDPAPPTPPVSRTYRHAHSPSPPLPSHLPTTHSMYDAWSQNTHTCLALRLQGLIARGDHRGSLVEKDEHSLSSQPVHPSLPTKQPPHHATADDQSQTHHLQPVQSHDNHVTSTLNQSPHCYRRNSTSGCTSESHGSHVIKQHQLVVPESSSSSMFTPPSSSSSMHDPSRPHLTTSDYSSSKSLPQHTEQLSAHSASSQQTSFTGYSSTRTTSSGLSSGSAGVAMVMSHHLATPMIHTPNSQSLHVVANGHPNYYSGSSGALSSAKEPSSIRPTSLGIPHPPGRSVKQQPASMMSSLRHYRSQQQKLSNQQQKFECPSCRKQFPYGPQEFDRWFEHIKYCENEPQCHNNSLID